MASRRRALPRGPAPCPAQTAAENLRSNTYNQWSVSNMDYDGAGRLTTLVLGNITTLADAATFITGTQTQNFTYDSLNRLISGKTSGYSTPSTRAYTETYGYDAIGNFITKTTGVTTTYNYTDTTHKHVVSALSSGNVSSNKKRCIKRAWRKWNAKIGWRRQLSFGG